MGGEAKKKQTKKTPIAAKFSNCHKSFLEEILSELNFEGKLEIYQMDKVWRVSQAEGSAYAKAQGHKSGLYYMK